MGASGPCVPVVCFAGDEPAGYGAGGPTHHGFPSKEQKYKTKWVVVKT